MPYCVPFLQAEQLLKTASCAKTRSPGVMLSVEWSHQWRQQSCFLLNWCLFLLFNSSVWWRLLQNSLLDICLLFLDLGSCIWRLMTSGTESYSYYNSPWAIFLWPEKVCWALHNPFSSLNDTTITSSIFILISILNFNKPMWLKILLNFSFCFMGFRNNYLL